MEKLINTMPAKMSAETLFLLIFIRISSKADQWGNLHSSSRACGG